MVFTSYPKLILIYLKFVTIILIIKIINFNSFDYRSLSFPKSLPAAGRLFGNGNILDDPEGAPCFRRND